MRFNHVIPPPQEIVPPPLPPPPPSPPFPPLPAAVSTLDAIVPHRRQEEHALFIQLQQINRNPVSGRNGRLPVGDISLDQFSVSSSAGSSAVRFSRNAALPSTTPAFPSSSTADGSSDLPSGCPPPPLDPARIQRSIRPENAAGASNGQEVTHTGRIQCRTSPRRSSPAKRRQRCHPSSLVTRFSFRFVICILSY